MDLYCDKTCSDKDIVINIIESTNSIYFNSAINTKSMECLIDKLLYMEQKILKKQKSLKRKFEEKTDKYSDTDNFLIEDYEEQFEIKIEPKPITLYISSYGGSVYQVLGAIDTISNMKVPINTVCKGLVASAGTLLSLAGKKRYITKNSYMLIHELRDIHWGKFTHLVESFENSKLLMDHIKSYYLSKTKITKEELDEQLKKDVIWNAEMCVEKGLVDEII